MKTLEALVERHLNAPNLSDIHIHADRPPVLRIAGRLSVARDGAPSENDIQAFANRCLSEDDDRRAQHAFDCGVRLGERRLRAHFYRQRGRMALALRVLPERQPTPEDIALPTAALSAMGRSGLVLVTGATGSGKSTTLAALIQHILTHRSAHVLTIEDPIEYPLSRDGALISRCEIGRDAPSFAAAVRAALRQDPDVILIGELRDVETARLALIAAETGHLVLSTLHAADCVGALSRLLAVFASDQRQAAKAQLAQSLRVVVAQRLLRRARGDGRVAAFEILRANQAVRSLIRDEKLFQILSVMQTASAEGMVTMDKAMARLREDGAIEDGAT